MATVLRAMYLNTNWYFKQQSFSYMYRQTLIYFCLVFINLNLFSQKIPKWNLPEKPMFFTGIPHELTIKANASDPEFITVKTSAGFITKLNDTTYTIRFDMPQEDFKLRLFYKKLPVDIVSAIVTNPVAPKLLINGYQNGPIPREELESLEELEFVFPEGFPSVGINIYSIRMNVKVNAHSQMTSLQLHSTKLTPQAKEILKKIEPGGSLAFDNIMFVTGSNHVLNLPRESHIFSVTQ